MEYGSILKLATNSNHYNCISIHDGSNMKTSYYYNMESIEKKFGAMFNNFIELQKSNFDNFMATVYQGMDNYAKKQINAALELQKIESFILKM